MEPLPEKVRAIIIEADKLPHGPIKVALYEEAVQVADSFNDMVIGFNARGLLIGEAISSGRPDIALVAFPWCLSDMEDHPDPFQKVLTLWYYKSIVPCALSFPEIHLEQIESLLDDMERRYSRMGSEHAVAELRRHFFQVIGDRRRAQKAHSIYRKTRRDVFSNCPRGGGGPSRRSRCWPVPAARPVNHFQTLEHVSRQGASSPRH